MHIHGASRVVQYVAGVDTDDILYNLEGAIPWGIYIIYSHSTEGLSAIYDNSTRKAWRIWNIFSS